MAQSAGGVSINLTLNTATYTKGLTQAQREMSKFVSGTRQGMHGTVTDVQSVSASLRALNGGFQNNLRSMERWVAQSKTATAVAKTMFPIVGAGTFAFLLAGMVEKVADFIKTANQMPKAIQMGFASLQLASQSSTDALRLTNDQLQNSINKLEGKPVNNLAIQFDESAKAADKLATSIENGSNKLNQLLSSNHLSGWALLTGKMGTADRQGTIKAFGDQQDSNAYDLATSTSSGNKGGIAKAQAALKATQEAELANLRGDLANRQANSKNPGALDDSANINIDKGAITAILNQQKEQAEELRNASLSAQKQKLDDAKAASEQAKAAASARVQAMQDGLDGMKLQYGMSIKAVYDYWEGMKAGEAAGGTAYSEIVRKQAQLAVEGAAKAHETIQKAIANSRRSDVQDQDIGSVISRIGSMQTKSNLSTAKTQTEGYEQSNDAAADDARNSARRQELAIQQALGITLTKQAAALELAAVHAAEYKAQLDAIAANRKLNASLPDSPEKQRRDAQYAKQYADVQTAASDQVSADKYAANPQRTSPLVGATDALNEFVNASRDAAAMMRDIVTNTLSSFNQTLVGTMTGQRGGFKQFGLSVTRNIASKGLQTAEGSALSALGFGGGGKLGTKGNPMYTISAGSGAGSPSALTSLIPSGKSSGVAGFFGGLMKTVLPFLATGGPIDGPAIVGEQGPELFMPSGAGTIVPNHQLATSSSNSNGSISYSIDARGTDPVQTEQRVRSAIVAAHQSSVTQAVKQVHQQSARQPARRR